MIGESAVEFVVVLLLIATCGYCVVLNRRLQSIKEGQIELQHVIAKFDEATRRAEKNLARMESSGTGMTRDLGAVMARANALVSELSIMVSAGDHIAGRIEGAVNNVRALGARRNGSGAHQ